MKWKNKKTGEIIECSPTLLNAAKLSAQNRKRLFWVGKWNGEKYEQVEISQPEDRGILLKDIIETGENVVYQDTYTRLEGKPREHQDKCFTLTSAMGTGGGHVPYIIYESPENLKPENKYPNDFPLMKRKLTPTECLRLQSMPDSYFDKAEYKGKPISNTQRYKMCGNAFNCAVIEHIFKQLEP